MTGLSWSDEEVARIGEGLLARDLPQPEWTHQAHFAALVHLVRARPEIDLERHLPRIIWRYNAAVGTPNSDMRGYHETVTRFYLAAVRAYLARIEGNPGPGAIVTALVNASFGQIGFPLRFYSREVLQSAEARRVWVEPDVAPFDFATCPLAVDAERDSRRWKAAPAATPAT
jgi:hypothetical protein